MIVGGTKNCNFQKIKDLNPTHILCNKEENTKEIVQECLKISYTHVSDIYTIQDTLKLIKHYENLFSLEKEASKMIAKIQSLLNDFEHFIKHKKKLKVAYFIWKNPWMVAANNTFINHILTLNNFENVFDNNARYPEVNIQKIEIEKNPDIIFLSSEPYPFKKEHMVEVQKIIPTSKIILIDGEMFSWPGSRLLKAFDYFKTLHNQL